jgi:phosphoribosylformylglycinamidine cyclo-ligase
LDPTILYVPVTEALFDAGIVPHYCANVTGHGWRKLMRHSKALTYRIHTLPPVPPVLSFLQSESGMDNREAYGTLNMGAGFALFVAPDQVEKVLRISSQAGVSALHAGVVEAGSKRVIIEPLQIEYGAEDLHLRA